ncbi:MAG: site-2 protease family protein [Actinomycetota bacterium]|nr:site-2 protease family protein [Actinomycetota bacterium]
MSETQTAGFIIGLIVGVILHEYMHGRVADILGDHTARNAGRLTLNPIAHIDPFGSILLPLVLIVLRSPFIFGYAKPVPVNPFFLRKPERDMLLVSLAGPVTNVGVAFIFALVGMVFRLFGLEGAGSLLELIFCAAQVNIVLAIFNLIPIPPLDGSHILEYFLPERMKEMYRSMGAFGFIIIFVLIWGLGDYIFKLFDPIFNFLGKIIFGF